MNRTNEVYQAFVNAGFAREARTLSESKSNERGISINPGLGHYIAIIDKLGLRDTTLTGNQIRLYFNALGFISEFLYAERDNINSRVEGTIPEELFDPSEVDKNGILKFVDSFNPREGSELINKVARADEN